MAEDAADFDARSFAADFDARMNKIIVTHVKGHPVTRGELSAAFDRVADSMDWKNPIDKVVDLDDWTRALVHEAVIFFTSSVPKFERLTGTTTSGIGRYRVTAAGYYSTCGS